MTGFVKQNQSKDLALISLAVFVTIICIVVFEAYRNYNQKNIDDGPLIEVKVVAPDVAVFDVLRDKKP